MKLYLSVFFSFPGDSYSVSREVGWRVGWHLYIDFCFVMGFQNCFFLCVCVFQSDGRWVFMSFFKHPSGVSPAWGGDFASPAAPGRDWGAAAAAVTSGLTPGDGMEYGWTDLPCPARRHHRHRRRRDPHSGSVTWEGQTCPRSWGTARAVRDPPHLVLLAV